MEKLPGEAELLDLVMEITVEADNGDIPEPAEVVRRFVQRIYEVFNDMPGVEFLAALQEAQRRRGTDGHRSDPVREPITETSWNSWS